MIIDFKKRNPHVKMKKRLFCLLVLTKDDQMDLERLRNSLVEFDLAL
jgi:hypothetical protein